MGKYEKLFENVKGGRSDTNIDFRELCLLLRRIGFDERSCGSHYIFRKTGIVDMINLQREGSEAKVYQVRQVRAIILKYNIEIQKR